MNPGLRIAYLVQQFLPEVGAGPARVFEMGRRWLQRDAALTVITAMPNRPEGRIHVAYRGKFTTVEEVEGIRVLRSWLYASPKHGFIRTIINNVTWMVTGCIHALLRMGPADVLIASSPPFFPHVAGVVVSRIRGVPLVLEIRDLWPDYLVDMGVLGGAPARALLALERWLLRRAALVVVVTDSFRRRVVAKGVAEDRVIVIPNGVDATFYRASSEAPPIPDLVRREGELLVGYLGNFGAGQNLATVIEAAALLGEERPDIRFVMAGDGPQRDALVELLQRRPRARLTIHPPLPKDKTRAFYNACDINLVVLAPVTVFQDTVPSKIFEVMACERPLVASLGGEAQRIVEESGAGVVVPPGDAAALAKGVVRLLAVPGPVREEMGRSARRYVSERYSREALADVYLNALEGVTQRG